MESKEQQVNKLVQKLPEHSNELLNSELAVLSDLNDEGLKAFRQSWGSIDAGQRLNLISRLVSISEEDFILDFTGIFKIGLEDPEEKIRIKALEGLELEDKYVFAPLVIKVLKADESEEVRTAAARTLGKFALLSELGDFPEVIGQDISEALMKVLENPAEPISIRRRALEAIAPFHDEVVEQYIEDYYHSEDPRVKASAIYAMGLNCDSRWLSFLISEMQNSLAEIRYEAAQASGQVGDEEAVPYLLKLLEDEDPEVQEAAIASLGKIGGKQAKQTLQKLARDPNNRIKEAAKTALTELSACEDPLSLNF